MRIKFEKEKIMKIKRLIAAILLISMIAAVLSMTIITTSAAGGTGYDSADDVVYKTSGSYIANWGARGEDCVFLSTYAQAFYTGQYVYSDMSQSAGGTSQSNAYQSVLYSELKTLMTSKHSHETSYGETRDQYKYTDCLQSNTSSISSFYSGKTISGNWDSGATWNREHTWPNSKGLDGNDENDIMMLRPTSVSENSSRGNKAYGQSSGYYNPNNESNGAYDLRGDVARITLYTYTRWGNTSKMWGSDGVMESLDVLLTWMEEDPVDTWEMGRNDAVQAITGTRNVFVDYPEYAWLLFGRSVPAGYTSPSQGAGTGGGSSNTTKPADTTTKPVSPDVPDTPIMTPEIGVAYKGMVDAASNGVLYMLGEPKSSTQTWFIKTTQDRASGVDIYLEAADGVAGGYRMYFMKNGTKTYIRAYERGATSGSIELTTTKPSEYYTYSEEFGTFIITGSENSFYIGTYINNGTFYDTLSCSSTYYISGDKAANIGVTQFPLQLVPAEQGSDDTTVKPDNTTKPSDTTVKPDTPVTPGGEMTIADAIAATDGTSVTVKGTVISIGQEWSTQYSDMSFTISDGSGEIYIFRSKTKVKVGDSVTVTGTRATYSGIVELKDCSVVINSNGDTTPDDPVDTTTNSSNNTTPTVPDSTTAEGGDNTTGSNGDQLTTPETTLPTVDGSGCAFLSGGYIGIAIIMMTSLAAFVVIKQKK